MVHQRCFVVIILSPCMMYTSHFLWVNYEIQLSPSLTAHKFCVCHSAQSFPPKRQFTSSLLDCVVSLYQHAPSREGHKAAVIHSHILQRTTKTYHGVQPPSHSCGGHPHSKQWRLPLHLHATSHSPTGSHNNQKQLPAALLTSTWLSLLYSRNANFPTDETGIHAQLGNITCVHYTKLPA